MKTAIVTGCGRGLGNALLDQLDGLGYLVAGATHGQMDVTSQISVVNFAFDFAQKHSSLDLLINNAAVILDSADAYSNVTAHGTGYIIPYHANTSLLYTTLNANGVNGMPKNLPPIPQCQVQAIYCWINQGALNN